MCRPRVRLRGIVGGIGEEEREALVGRGEANELDQLGAVLEVAGAEAGERVMIRDVLCLVTEQGGGERRVRKSCMRCTVTSCGSSRGRATVKRRSSVLDQM